MTASATIDTISYLNTAPATSSNKPESNSGGFQDIFENANKTYSKEEYSAKNSEVKNQDKKTEISNNSSTNKTETSGTTKSAEDTKKVISPESEESQAKLEKIVNMVKEKGVSELEKIPEIKELISQMQEFNIEISDIAKMLADTQTPENADSNLNSTAGENLTAEVQSLLSTLQDAIVKEVTVSDMAQNKTSEPAQLAQNLKTAADNIQAQPANEKLSQQVSEQAKQSTADTANTPVIKVNAEVLASDINVSTNDTNAKDITGKTSVSQEILDKTNAKVVSVETTAANSNNNSNSNGNLLKQQSAAEQAVKLSLESNSRADNTTAATNTTSNADIAGLTDAASQTNFTKTLDGVQMQAPKDLSKSDIMSQIYSKFDNLQEEGTTKLTIVLKPENLGKIHLELINGKDGLTARMTTDNAQVKELLDKNLNVLKDTLSNQGVNVDNVSVKVNDIQKQASNDMLSFDRQTGQEDRQQQSNNAQNSKQNEFIAGEELEDADETAEIETETLTEKSVSIGSGSKKVDYKV